MLQARHPPQSDPLFHRQGLLPFRPPVYQQGQQIQHQLPPQGYPQTQPKQAMHSLYMKSVHGSMQLPVQSQASAQQIPAPSVSSFSVLNDGAPSVRPRRNTAPPDDPLSLQQFGGSQPQQPPQQPQPPPPQASSAPQPSQPSAHQLRPSTVLQSVAAHSRPSSPQASSGMNVLAARGVCRRDSGRRALGRLRRYTAPPQVVATQLQQQSAETAAAMPVVAEESETLEQAAATATESFTATESVKAESVSTSRGSSSEQEVVSQDAGAAEPSIAPAASLEVALVREVVQNYVVTEDNASAAHHPRRNTAPSQIVSARGMSSPVRRMQLAGASAGSQMDGTTAQRVPENECQPSAPMPPQGRCRSRVFSPASRGKLVPRRLTLPASLECPALPSSPQSVRTSSPQSVKAFPVQAVADIRPAKPVSMAPAIRASIVPASTARTANGFVSPVKRLAQTLGHGGRRDSIGRCVGATVAHLSARQVQGVLSPRSVTPQLRSSTKADAATFLKPLEQRIIEVATPLRRNRRPVASKAEDHVALAKSPVTARTNGTRVVACTLQGQKIGYPAWVNQDEHLIQWLSEDLLVIGVFDGHGGDGHHISRRLRELVLEHFHTLALPDAQQSAAAFQRFFTMAHLVLHREGLARFSGTTVTLVVLDTVAGTLTTAHVGDSRLTVFCNGVLTFETRDHVITAEDESRILSHGGEVREESGARRIFTPGKDTPGLAMARSLGDLVAHSCGALIEPSVALGVPFEHGSTLLLASDGVWDVVPATDPAIATLLEGENLDLAAAKLAALARSRWPQRGNIDDVTVLIVRRALATA